ncbi:REP-associated tyrosine transposase [Labrys neptuniae]
MVETKPHLGWYRPHSLPHFDSPEATQFVTFRLVDSLPTNFANPIDRMELNRRQIERELDRGLGACWLGMSQIAYLVQQALFAFDQERYRLWAWCIMPNHVHCLFETIEGHRLGDIIRSWKKYTALRANRVLQRDGAFWQRDYFDRFVRNEEQFGRTIDYIERNPVKAGLCRHPIDWKWSSARFRSGE